MEIQLLPKNSLRVKGKQAAIGVNAAAKNNQWNAILLIGDQATTPASIADDGTLIINGPGEYEVKGLKISGVRNKSETVYSLTVDGVDCMVGTINALSESQQRLKEHNIVVVASYKNLDASFITNFAANAVLFFGDNAHEVVNAFAKENVKTLPKYQTTADKLPAEMETVLLQ